MRKLEVVAISSCLNMISVSCVYTYIFLNLITQRSCIYVSRFHFRWKGTWWHIPTNDMQNTCQQRLTTLSRETQHFACAYAQENKAWTLPLHGFSSVRQVHFNTVLPLICLHANPIKQPSFPEFSIHCKTQTSITVSFTRYDGNSMSICKLSAVEKNVSWIAFI